MYLIAREWHLSIPAAFVAAMLFNLDGLNVTESRLILMDAQLIFWYGVKARTTISVLSPSVCMLYGGAGVPSLCCLHLYGGAA